jgi:hypothetical protein
MIIIPAAGQSSRFNTRPKPFLTNPNGNLMLKDCLSGIKYDCSIIITVLREHLQKYCDNDVDIIKKAVGKDVTVHVLENATGSQCETIYQTLIDLNIVSQPIFIKDVDNRFDVVLKSINGVCYSTISSTTKNLAGKSYITHEDNLITNIVEKSVISNYFCVGGYSFENCDDYIRVYERIKNREEEIYTSDIIKELLPNNFEPLIVDNYHDWGTYDDWVSYKDSFRTIFCDIDGTLFENSGQFTTPGWGDAEPIYENLNYIKEMQKKYNVQLILTTSRKEEYREITKIQLENYGVKYDRLIMGLYHCRRYLINDYSLTNPYPTAVSINLERDSEKLKDLFK